MSASAGMNGNSAYTFWTAPAGTAVPTKPSGSNAGGLSAWNLVKTDYFRSGGNSATGSITVPNGEVMFIAYDCNIFTTSQTSSGCSYQEAQIDITPAIVGPDLPPIPTTPAAACSPNCVPTGSETPSVTFTLPAGKEAYMEWTTSSGPGGDENEIYY
jgi:hypothetical protein